MSEDLCTLIDCLLDQEIALETLFWVFYVLADAEATYRWQHAFPRLNDPDPPELVAIAERRARAQQLITHRLDTIREKASSQKNPGRC